MKNFCLFFLIILTTGLFGQSDTIPPSFNGKNLSLSEFIDKNLKYPEAALEYKIQGDVIVSFVVEVNGTITNLKVVEGLEAGCNKEAVRIIGLTNNLWSPGKVDNTPVRLKMLLPVKFSIVYGKNISYLINDPYKKGLELMKLEDYVKAIEEFSMFLISFKSSSAHYARGVCFLMTDDFRNAIVDFEEANTLGDPDAKTKLPEAYLKYGNKLVEQKKYPAAIGIFTKALEYTPNEVNVLYNRGISYYYIGEKSKACEDWKLIKSLGSNESIDVLKAYCNE